MVQILYPVFEIDGEEYVADISLMLASNPPQYHAYALKDKKHRYVKCSDAHAGSKIMYPHDFMEFMNGKGERQRLTNGFAGQEITFSTSVKYTSGLPIVAVTHPRPLTNEEKIQVLEKAVTSLKRKVNRLNKIRVLNKIKTKKPRKQ